MKKLNNSCLAIGLFFLCSQVSATLPTARSQNEIAVVGDSWCPFSCGIDSSPKGVMVDVLKEIFPAANEQYLLKQFEVTWSRAIAETRLGRYDILLGALKEDVPDFVFPKNPVAFQKSCFYVNPDSNWKYKDLASLPKHRLGAMMDYKYGEPLDDYIKANGGDLTAVDLMSGTDGAYRLFLKLKSKRIDIMIEDESVARFILNSKKDLVSFQPKKVGCLKALPLYMAFSPVDQKRSQELARKFDQGFVKLKQSGRLKQIMKSYGL